MELGLEFALELGCLEFARFFDFDFDFDFDDPPSITRACNSDTPSRSVYRATFHQVTCNAQKMRKKRGCGGGLGGGYDGPPVVSTEVYTWGLLAYCGVHLQKPKEGHGVHLQ